MDDTAPITIHCHTQSKPPCCYRLLCTSTCSSGAVATWVELCRRSWYRRVQTTGAAQLSTLQSEVTLCPSCSSPYCWCCLAGLGATQAPLHLMAATSVSSLSQGQHPHPRGQAVVCAQPAGRWLILSELAQAWSPALWPHTH